MKKLILLFILSCGITFVNASDNSNTRRTTDAPYRDSPGLLNNILNIATIVKNNNQLFEGNTSTLCNLLMAIEGIQEDSYRLDENHQLGGRYRLESSYKLYDYNSNSPFNEPTYTVVSDKNGYSVYKGKSDFSTNLLCAIVITKDGYELYKGNPAFSSNILLSVERDRDSYRIYKGDKKFSTNQKYTLAISDNRGRSDANGYILNDMLYLSGLVNQGTSILNNNPDFLRDLLQIAESAKDRTYKLYKDNPSFSTNLLCTTEVARNSFKLYKGDSTFGNNLICAIVFTQRGYEIYNDDPAFRNNLLYTIEAGRNEYRVYNGRITNQSTLLYTLQK